MSSHGWAITIEVAAEPNDPAHVTDDALEAFAETMATDYAGAVSGGAGFDRYGATFSLNENHVREHTGGNVGLGAVINTAVAIFDHSRTTSGLPLWPVVAAEAKTYAEQDRELDQPAWPQLVGVAELAQILGVSKQRVSTLAHRDDFPEPIANLKAGPVWTRGSITRFLDEWDRRPGRPTKEHQAV